MIKTLFIILFALLAALAGFLYYAQYFVWRHCFNDQGRCFDPATGIVYLEQAGLIWGAFAAFFALCAVIIARKKLKR